MLTDAVCGSGVQITHGPDTCEVMMAATSRHEIDDMLYAFISTLKGPKVRMPRRKILGLCIRALIYND